MGEPLVLISGGEFFGSPYSLDAWSLNLPELARHFHVFAIDKLGQGYTENPKSEAEYTFEALFEHIGEGLIDYVLINHNWNARQPDGWLGQPVQIDERRLEELPVVVIEEDLVDVANAHRHDSAKLAAALVRLQQEDRLERPRQRRLRRPAASAS